MAQIGLIVHHAFDQQTEIQAFVMGAQPEALCPYLDFPYLFSGMAELCALAHCFGASDVPLGIGSSTVVCRGFAQINERVSWAHHRPRFPMPHLSAAIEPNPLTNVDADFYRQRIPAAERLDGVHDRDLDVIVSTLPDLILAPSDAAIAQEFTHLDHDDCDLQVDALAVTLVGTLRIPSGRVVLRCRVLKVPKDGAAVDVSAPALPNELKEPFRPPTVNWYAGIDFARYSGIEVSKALRDNEPLPPGLTSFAGSFGAKGIGPGMAGSVGGTIDITAEGVQMEGSLYLRADGGDGAAGCYGANVPGVPSEAMVQAVPVLSLLNAAPGGQGGTGGSIRVFSATKDGPGEWRASCRGGASGKPGLGGTISFWDGHGGLSRQGQNARTIPDGPAGAVENLDNDSTTVAERPWDALFLRKAIQCAQRTYLMHPLTANPDGSAHFPPKWNDLGTLLAWLESLLRRFEDSSSSAGIDAARKGALYRTVASLLRRHVQNQTYFGDDPNVVPVLPLKDLEKDFSKAWTRRADLEKHVQEFAVAYQAGRDSGEARKELVTGLRASVDAHKDAIAETWKGLPDLQQTCDDASRQLEQKKEALKTELENFKNAVSNAFDGCHLDNLLEGAVMCLFVGSGGPGAVAGMAALQLSKMGVDSWTSLTDDQGHAVNKSFVISEVKAVEGDLVKAAQKELFEGEPPRLKPEGTRLLTSIDALEQQIGKLSGKLPGAASKALAALEAFKESLIERGRTQMVYTNAVARLVEENHYLQVTGQQLERARKPDGYFTPEWMDMAVFAGELYHRQVIRLLELDDRIRRKAMYLTLDAGAMASTDRSSDALWLRRAGDRESSSIAGMKTRFDNEVAGVRSYRETQASSIFPVPASDDQRSLLVAVIGPGRLLDDFRKTGRLSFTAVQAGLEGTAADRIVVADADLYYDARVTHIQPRIFGATTEESRSGNRQARLNIKVKSGGESTIVDRRNIPHIFQHPARETELTHLVHTSQTSPTQSDLQGGGTGVIKGEYHDAIGLFSRWSLNVPGSTQVGANRGLELKHVSAVHVYFRVLASSAPSSMAFDLLPTLRSS